MKALARSQRLLNGSERHWNELTNEIHEGGGESQVSHCCRFRPGRVADPSRWHDILVERASG